MKIKLVVILFTVRLAQISCEHVEVQTKSGRIKGGVHKTIPDGKTYYAFKGIRYAKPPKRFRPAEPVEKWDGVYNALKDKAICMQILPSFRKESEDCLFLNVYTVKLPKINVNTSTFEGTKEEASPTDYDDYYDNISDFKITKSQIVTDDNNTNSSSKNKIFRNNFDYKDYKIYNKGTKNEETSLHKKILKYFEPLKLFYENLKSYAASKDLEENLDREEDYIDPEVEEDFSAKVKMEKEHKEKSKKVKEAINPDSSSQKLAVMVWIHGGAFTSGDSTYKTYGPDYLLNEGVIVVSLNYRLGAFGFLTTGDGKIPANLGMKDIIIALQWIKENIEFFGGDPDNITIFGESAGAALTSYLMMSPLTKDKGYFHKAIMQSGNSLCPWSFQRDPMTLYNSMVTASGCIFFTFGGPREVYKCLKRMDRNVLRLASTAVFGFRAGFQIDIINQMSFSLVLENPDDPSSAVIEGPYNYLKEGRLPNIPFIMGTNSEESVALNSFLSYLKPLFLQIDMNPLILVPQDMYATKKAQKKYIVPYLLRYYYNNNVVSKSSDESTLRFVSDNFFNRPFREFFSLVGDKVRSYCYKLSYVGKMGGVHDFHEGLDHVGHADDLNYLFRNNQSAAEDFPEQDFVIRHRLTRMWTNFAKYGKPTPKPDPLLQNTKWPSAFLGGTDIRCLDIRANLKLLKNPYDDVYKMWRELYTTYGSPKDTY